MKKRLTEIEEKHSQEMQNMMTQMEIEIQKGKRFEAEVKVLRAKLDKSKAETVVANQLKFLSSSLPELQSNIHQTNDFIVR